MSDLLCLENLPILDLWKSFRLSLGYESIGEKARQSRDSVLEFWNSEASFSERDCIFLHFSLQEGRVDNLLETH